MVAARVLVGLAGAAVVLAALASALRSVVLPRAIPARLARVAFLSVRGVLRWLAARAARRGRHRRREELLSLQGPLGLFAQLLVWAGLVAIGFAAVMWAVDRRPLSVTGARDALRESASAVTTMGNVNPEHPAAQFVGFAEAAVGLVLLALAITYLPTIYSAFSRREALVAKMTVRTGAPPTPTVLLIRSWELSRFDRLEEVWTLWEDWFIDVGESHTTFPVLPFFRSPRSGTSWVTAAVAALDAAGLARHAVDAPADSRALLCVEAGIDAFELLAEFLALPPERTAQPRLLRAVFEQAVGELAAAGLPVVADTDAAWEAFAADRVAYERQALVVAALADAVPTAWLPADQFIEYRPPIVNPRPHEMDGSRVPR